MRKPTAKQTEISFCRELLPGYQKRWHGKNLQCRTLCEAKSFSARQQEMQIYFIYWMKELGRHVRQKQNLCWRHGWHFSSSAYDLPTEASLCKKSWLIWAISTIFSSLWAISKEIEAIESNEFAVWLKRYALCVMFCWISNFQTINYSVWRAQHFTGNLNRLVFSIFRDCVLLKKLDRSGFIWLLSRLTSSRCLVKVKKKHCKNRVRTILINVGPKKIVIGQNRSNWKRYSQEDFCRDWSNNVK